MAFSSNHAFGSGVWWQSLWCRAQWGGRVTRLAARCRGRAGSPVYLCRRSGRNVCNPRSQKLYQNSDIGPEGTYCFDMAASASWGVL